MLKHGIENRMSSYVINSVSDFDSDSDFESDSNFSLASINLIIFALFFLYVHSSK